MLRHQPAVGQGRFLLLVQRIECLGFEEQRLVDLRTLWIGFLQFVKRLDGLRIAVRVARHTQPVLAPGQVQIRIFQELKPRVLGHQPQEGVDRLVMAFQLHQTDTAVMHRLGSQRVVGKALQKPTPFVNGQFEGHLVLVVHGIGVRRQSGR